MPGGSLATAGHATRTRFSPRSRTRLAADHREASDRFIRPAANLRFCARDGGASDIDLSRFRPDVLEGQFRDIETDGDRHASVDDRRFCVTEVRDRDTRRGAEPRRLREDEVTHAHAGTESAADSLKIE